jgi:hypothetical protein
MPNDSSPPSPEENSTTRPSSRKAEPKSSSARSRKVHVVLGGKGGIGKTHIAALIAQALAERGDKPLCFDADPVNASLHEIAALKAEPVTIFCEDSEEADIESLDGMFERWIEANVPVVVDVGAAAFIPMSRYLLQVCDWMVESALVQPIVHAIIAAGPELAQTADDFDRLAEQFPASVPMVLWLNPHHGSLVSADGTRFRDAPVVRKHDDRLAGIVELPTLSRFFRHSLARMTERRMTFAEADVSDLYVMDKQRLRQIWRPLSEQIAAVL